MKMKFFVVALAMGFAFASCGDDEPEPTVNPGTNNEVVTPEPEPEPEPQPEAITIDLEIASKTSTSVFVNATPSNLEVPYFLMCETEAYVGQFESEEDLMTEEVNYWMEEFGSDYAEYGFESIEQLIVEGVCDKGVVTNFEFGKRKPSTNYVVYAFSIDPQTLTATSELFTLDVTTDAKESGNWDYVGVGSYQEGFFGALFGIGTKEIDVEIYKDSKRANTYSMKNPYGPEMLCEWWYNENVTMEMLEEAEGEVWQETYYEFTINSDNTVDFPLQDLGIYVEANLNGVDYAGWPQAGTPAEYGMAGGNYANGVITIPTRGAVIAFPEVSKAYYGNTNGDFMITMPTGANVKAKAAKNYVEKDNTKKSSKFLSPIFKKNIKAAKAISRR